MKILSFVIPAYNSERFLEKCIPSMLVPELLDKLEIIVVNDGSADATAETAGKYCTQYPGTVRLISQENKGHGGALNTGCAAATGKYLKVIDADDWIVTENLPAFAAALETCESDVVLTHHHTIDIGTGAAKEWKCTPKNFGVPMGFEEIMADWHSYDMSLTFHGITYRTEFYHRQNHILPEHVFYEDHEYATFPCCRADTVTALDLFVYEYRVGDVNQSVSAANQLKRIGHMETVLWNMIRAWQQLPESRGKHYASVKIQGVLLSYLTTALLVNPDKKAGRIQAAAQMDVCRRAAPEIYSAVNKKYRVFSLLNRLHIGKAAWDRFLTSGIYRLLRGKMD